MTVYISKLSTAIFKNVIRLLKPVILSLVELFYLHANCSTDGWFYSSVTLGNRWRWTEPVSDISIIFTTKWWGFVTGNTKNQKNLRLLL